VVSWREKKDVVVPKTMPDSPHIAGDIAWGGNWFFLIESKMSGPLRGLVLENVSKIAPFAGTIREMMNRLIAPQVDHIEFFGPPEHPGSHSRNFVLCPGGAYDRSPCGTGTSAKLACLAADGKLAEGEEWVQESILGTTFTGTYRWHDRAAGQIIPTITGQAYVTGEATLLLDDRDPFCWGIR
jgi:proline racemase